MKRLLFSAILAVVLAWNASAEPQDVLKHYLRSAETVCLATVTTVKDHEVTFSISQMIKGKLEKIVQLQDVERSEVKGECFSVNSEWLLVSTNSKAKTLRMGWGVDTSWVAAWAWTYKHNWKPCFDGSFLSYESIRDTTCLSWQQVKELADAPL